MHTAHSSNFDFNTAISRVIETYCWHMTSDLTYRVNRQALSEELSLQKIIKNAKLKIEKRGPFYKPVSFLEKYLFTSIPYSLQTLEVFSAKSIRMLNWLTYENSDHLMTVNKKSACIPAKTALLLYTIFDRCMKDDIILDNLRIQLNSSPKAETNEGTLRDWINFRSDSDWNFDDKFLPYPSDDSSSGRRGWAHRYKQKLFRTMFPNKIPDPAILSIGQKMLYCSEEEFEYFLNFGHLVNGGFSLNHFLEPDKYNCNEIKDFSYIGLYKFKVPTNI